MTKDDLKTAIGLFLDCYAARVEGVQVWTKDETTKNILDAVERYENSGKFDKTKYSNLPNG